MSSAVNEFPFEAVTAIKAVGVNRAYRVLGFVALDDHPEVPFLIVQVRARYLAIVGQLQKSYYVPQRSSFLRLRNSQSDRLLGLGVDTSRQSLALQTRPEAHQDGQIFCRKSPSVMLNLTGSSRKEVDNSQEGSV
jgi:hypothetical protein